MKKITMMIFAAGLFYMHATAQFSRGTIMLGTTIGTTGYSSANSDFGYDVGTLRSTDTKTFTFSIGPQVGFFLNPHMILGATPAFSISNSKVTSNTTNTDASTSGTTSNTTTTTVTLGPFMRYYLSGITGRNWIYVQVNGAVGTGWGTSSGTSYSETSNGNSNGQVSNIFTWNSGASIGMTHFFDKRIGMDVALGYSYSHVHNYDTNTSNSTNATTGKITASTNNYTLNTSTNGVTFGIGFHWFLKG